MGLSNLYRTEINVYEVKEEVKEEAEEKEQKLENKLNLSSLERVFYVQIWQKAVKSKY